MTALLSSSSRAPLDNDDVEPLGLSLLELEEEETTDHVIGDLTITLRGYPRSSGQTLQCTGETTWRGGDLLARHLWRRRATTASVVEVGSGLGLVALAAKRLGVAPVVVATDGDDRALDKLRRNCGREVAVERLRWGDAEDLDRVLTHSSNGFSLVLGADVAYTAEAVPSLARTCRALLAPGGQVIIAYTRRHVDADAVLEAFADEGLVMRRDALSDDEREDSGDRVWYFSLVEPPSFESSEDEEEEPWAFDVDQAAESLVSDGYAVVENATRGLARTLRREVLGLAEHSLLKASPNALRTSNGREVRAKTNVEELQIHIRGAPILDDAAVVAARNLCPSLRDFGGREARVLGSKLSSKLGASLRVDEVKAAVHGAGGCFPAHLDTTDATGRCVTGILYLAAADVAGGELRIYPSSGGPPVDMAPSLDTLVLFSSTTTLHRTLPLKRGARPLVSFWFSSPTPLLADRTASNKLVKLLHAEDYARSFRDAFTVDGAVEDALALDAAANAAAEAALTDGERATLDAWRRRLDLRDMRKFLTTACPRSAGVVQCSVKRNRSGTNKLFPEYAVYTEEGDRFLMCSKNQPNNETSNYLISMGEGDLKRNSKNYIGNLRANFAGTEFQVFDSGANPSLIDTGSSERCELGAVVYTPNDLGARGPRKMQAAVPKLDRDGKAQSIIDVLAKLKAQDKNDITYTISKPPRWNDQVGAYVLNFNGRVTMASVRNFQLVEPDEQDAVLLQFGRVGKDEFTLDFRYPLTPFQAFAIALSAFDSKVACD